MIRGLRLLSRALPRRQGKAGVSPAACRPTSLVGGSRCAHQEFFSAKGADSAGLKARRITAWAGASRASAGPGDQALKLLLSPVSLNWYVLSMVGTSRCDVRAACLPKPRRRQACSGAILLT